MNEEVKTCPKCGNEFSGNFCPKCGHSMVTLCPNCKTQIEGDNQFCPTCGKSLAPAKSKVNGASFADFMSKIKDFFKKIPLKAWIIVGVSALLILVLGLGLGLGIPVAQSPFKAKKLNALALGMTTDEVKTVLKLKDLDDVEVTQIGLLTTWELSGGKAGDILAQIEKNSKKYISGDISFEKAYKKELKLYEKLVELEYDYLFLEFIDDKLDRIIYDANHKYTLIEIEGDESHLFNSAETKIEKDYELSRDEFVPVIDGYLGNANISCKVNFSDKSFYVGYLDGMVDGFGEQEVNFKTKWFDIDVKINVVEKLSTECPGHNMESCICTICGQWFHRANANCVCENCGLPAHTTDSTCKCTKCSQVYHYYNEATGICVDCGAVYGLNYVLDGESYKVEGTDSTLSSIKIPETYQGKNITSIVAHTFKNWYYLSEVSLSKKINHIGVGAFYNCSSLTEINFDGTKEQWNNVTKDSSWDAGTGNYAVYCSDGIVYKNSQNGGSNPDSGNGGTNPDGGNGGTLTEPTASDWQAVGLGNSFGATVDGTLVSSIVIDGAIGMYWEDIYSPSFYNVVEWLQNNGFTHYEGNEAVVEYVDGEYVYMAEKTVGYSNIVVDVTFTEATMMFMAGAIY